MENWFEELSLMRKRFNDSVQENKFDKGIRNSTVEKYADPEHFVFELLQNAEDQGATEAQFALSTDRLVFRHNGSPFTRADVENITGIGNSDKTQEANKIGRFGIGFKSVFAITERPEIYTLLEDNPFAFAIEHLVVPVVISGNFKQSHQYNTQFIFPFIKGQEITLYSKIRERVSTLGFETLLFLQNLASIEWQTKTDNGVYLREVKGSRHELFGESRENGQLRQSSAHYLMFTRNVSLSDNDRELDVRVAFKLDEMGKIIAEPGQKLAVYFPTEQVTGLSFRLHGPFLLTNSRETIKIENDTNNRLIQESAVLLGESVQQIKTAGLLTADFLSLLPIRRDNKEIPFRPLYDEVLKVLKQHPLLPTADGAFASAPQVKLARGVDLRDLLTEQQLSSFYGISTPLHWLSTEITADRTPDLYQYLTKDLEVEVVGPDAFVRKLEMPFLQKQPNEWLVKLYTFLSKQQRLNDIIKSKPILRLEDGRHVAPYNRYSPYPRNETPNAYLLREGNSELPLVKRSLISDDTVYSFLKDLGLSEPDIVDEVLNFILPPYEADEIALDNENRFNRDLDYFQKALQRRDHHARRELSSRLNETPFLQAINAKTSERAWKAPYEVYSRTEELSTWFEGNEQTWFIAGSLPGTLCADLHIRNHLQPEAKVATGNTGYVKIHDWYGHHQRGLHRFDPDASLDGLQHALTFITLDKARILWNILLEHSHLIKGVVERSNQQNFSKPREEKKSSQLGKLCCKEAWIPDQKGDFCSPDELFLTDLPEGFEKSTDEAHELAKKLGMRKAEELQFAETLGIPHEDISYIIHNLEAIRAWCEQQQKKPSLPSSITNDPIRRQEKAAHAAHTSEVKTYKALTLNRRTSAGYSEPKTYLRILNRNEEGQLICQLCHHPMPFKLPNGKEYFEAYQFIDNLDKEYVANHLALCPNCAAEFQYACQTDEDKRSELLLDLDPTVDEANLIVHIDTPVNQKLRFTQKHLFDLQAAVKDSREADPDPSRLEMDMSVT